jgi:hypothetical protein
MHNAETSFAEWVKSGCGTQDHVGLMWDHVGQSGCGTQEHVGGMWEHVGQKWLWDSGTCGTQDYP